MVTWSVLNLRCNLKYNDWLLNKCIPIVLFQITVNSPHEQAQPLLDGVLVERNKEVTIKTTVHITLANPSIHHLTIVRQLILFVYINLLGYETKKNAMSYEFHELLGRTRMLFTE